MLWFLSATPTTQKSFFDYFPLILRLILIITDFLIIFDFLLFDFATVFLFHKIKDIKLNIFLLNQLMLNIYDKNKHNNCHL